MCIAKKIKFLFIFLLPVFVSLVVSSPCAAKVEILKKPDSSYNVKSIKNIVVLPITSENVDYGKVTESRLPKIKAIMEKTKIILRRNWVDGSRLSNATIGFHANSPGASASTAILKLNIDEFDNGNQGARLLPFAGKSKVTVRGRLLDARDKKIITEFKAQVKNKDGMSGLTQGIGGTDSDVLLLAANEANGQLYKHLAKLIGFKYDKFANLGEKAKMSVQDTGNVMKEEKREIEKSK
ncbi:MAG: hypothetical protein Q7T11_01680 [Deltaproteobacteria bacterium]|nr:hypothetical protein [Deltaproteobacteria bacterium]